MSDDKKSLNNEADNNNTANKTVEDKINSEKKDSSIDTLITRPDKDNADTDNSDKAQLQSEPDISESNGNEPDKKQTDTADVNDAEKGYIKPDNSNISGREKLYKLLRILCIIGFVLFGALFINEVVIQPIRIKSSIDLTRDLYKKPTPSVKPTSLPTPIPTVALTPEPTQLPPAPAPDPNRDEQGRLLQFSQLLAVNDDVKGWITIPDTNIDYVVVQSDEDNPELYLDKDINLEYSKAGTLFLDIHSSVENNSKSLVIHGHNMVSTPEKMFHDLIKYKVDKANKTQVPNFYKQHPLINFDTIYQTGQWKIFAVFITNGSNKKEAFFDYTKSDFEDASDFLNFVYQIRIRSELNIDSVDITDTDQLLVLSTCSYEVDNYRTVVVARKVRDNEDPTVDTEAVTVNKTPLYPESYYYRYGGQAPNLPETFEEALDSGLINWYTPPELVEEKLKLNAGNEESENPDTAGYNTRNNTDQIDGSQVTGMQNNGIQDNGTEESTNPLKSN